MASFEEKDGQEIFTLIVIYVLGVITGLVNNDVTINARTILIPVSILAIIGAFYFNRQRRIGKNIKRRPEVVNSYRKL